MLAIATLAHSAQAPHLVVEEVVQPHYVVLILGVSCVDMAEQLDLVQALVKVVLRGTEAQQVRRT